MIPFVSLIRVSGCKRSEHTLHVVSFGIQLELDGLETSFIDVIFNNIRIWKSMKSLSYLVV